MSHPFRQNDAHLPQPEQPTSYTTTFLLIDLKLLLSEREHPQPDVYYQIYYQHWELYQRKLVTRLDFDQGVSDTYAVLSTPQLVHLHELINSVEPTITELPGPYSHDDCMRLMNTIGVVFKYRGEEGAEACMSTAESVFAEIRAKRTMRGM